MGESQQHCTEKHKSVYWLRPFMRRLEICDRNREELTLRGKSLTEKELEEITGHRECSYHDADDGMWIHAFVKTHQTANLRSMHFIEFNLEFN